MNNTLTKISTFEAISLIIIVMLNNLIMSVPKEILKNTSSAAWINVIILSVLATVFIVLICKLFKNFPSMDIIDISDYIGGKPLKFVIGILFIIMFLFVSATFLRAFVDLLQIIFLNHTPLVFIIAFFLAGIIIANKLGISTIAKVASIAVVLELISFIILIVSLGSYYNVYNLFPILGYGPSATFLSGLTNIYAFAGIAILYFIKPMLTSEKHFNKVAIISVIVSGVILLLCVLNQLLMFGVMFDSEILTGIVLSSRILNFGHFFQRVDAIFTFLWIFSQLAYLSIASFLAVHILKKITNISSQNGMLYAIIMIIFSIAIIPHNFIEMADSFIPYINSFKSIMIFVVAPIILILANLKFKKKSGDKDG